MKKKYFIGIAAAAMLGIAAVNVNYALRGNDLSALSLANLEALAGETSGANTSCCVSWEVLGIKYSCSISCNRGKQASCRIFGGCKCK